MISIIAAITSDRAAIGRRGDLLFHISEDLRHFKELTTGHTVVMGRNTFESLPKGALPNRRNIVVTRNPDFCADGVETAPSPEAALQLAATTPERTVFIIGGGEIYRAFLPHADVLDLTMIDAPTPADADTFFPDIDPSQWQITELGDHLTSAKTGIPFRFLRFSRTQP